MSIKQSTITSIKQSTIMSIIIIIIPNYADPAKQPNYLTQFCNLPNIRNGNQMRRKRDKTGLQTREILMYLLLSTTTKMIKMILRACLIRIHCSIYLDHTNMPWPQTQNDDPEQWMV